MEKMIKKIENVVISNLIYYRLVDQEDIEIYKFGFECFCLKVIHYTTYCMVAMAYGCLYEFLIFIVSYMMLRKYAGGIHAKTRIGCLVISNIFLSGVLIIGQWIEKGLLLSVISILGLLLIIIFAPVDNPNRVLSDKERNKFRKCAIFVCLIELIMSFVGYEVELFKWVQLGVIVSAFITICGKMKYSSLSIK